MARADLLISLQNAVAARVASRMSRERSAEELHGGEADLPPPSPPTMRRSLPRRLLRRLFIRYIEYARRYLTASVEHRLTLQQEATARLLEGLMEQRAGVQLLSRIGDSLDAHRLETARAREELAALRSQLAALQNEVRGVPGIIGPRLDELDIKVRPMIAFDDESYAVRLRDGYAMVPRDQPLFAVMVANASSGGLEPGVRRVLQALALPGATAADVGANVGLLTLALGFAVGPAGRVYAFEPEPGPRRQLLKTLQLNGLRWVEASDVAIGAQAGTATFYGSPIIGHSSLYALPEDEGQGRLLQVEVRPLDEILPPGSGLDVVKIDVEGAELDVLTGMSRLLDENADIALVAEYGPSHLARVGITPQAWFDAFMRHGFIPYEIGERTGVCRAITLDDVRDVESVNIAFVRPGGAAEGRLPR